MGSYGPFGRMPAYSQFSPSPIVGQQSGTVGVRMFIFIILCFPISEVAGMRVQAVSAYKFFSALS